MRNRLLKDACRALALMTAVLLLFGCAPVSAEDTVHETKALIDGILSYRLKAAGAADVQSWLDHHSAENAAGDVWTVLSLRVYDPSLDFSAYGSALEESVRDHAPSGASAREKLALTLMACGRKDSAFVQKTCNEAIGAQGIMSLIFGLHLLSNGQTSALYTKDELADTLMSMQLSDGGWALRGDVGDVDVTAMTLQALARCEGVSESLEKGLSFLSARQNDDGGYSGFGEPNAESTAQAIIALTALGVDPLADERFIKGGQSAVDALRGYRREDRSFSHTQGGASNATATTQALMALSALYSYQTGGRAFYDLSAVPQTSAGRTASLGWRAWACIALGAAAVIVCLILFAAGKRHYKNYLFVLGLCGVLCLLVCFVNIRSAEEYYGHTDEKGEIVGQATITIRCDTLAGRAQSEYVPEDGVILPETALDIEAGETVYDLLVEAARVYKIQMESEGTGGMVYVSGIGYLYEFDYGDLSGWMYRVNGETPSVGCAEYALSDDDCVEWLYTCDLGRDLDSAADDRQAMRFIAAVAAA